MKKLHKVLIVVVVAVAAIITGTTVMSVAGSEPAVEFQVVDENIAEMIKLELVAIDLNLPVFTNEELAAMYPAPGLLEWLTASQAHTIDISPRLPVFTNEELAAMYPAPGLLEWLTASQAQADDSE